LLTRINERFGQSTIIDSTLQKGRIVSVIPQPASGAYQGHYEASVVVPAAPEAVFSDIDTPDRLSSHMTRRSWMMAGSRMDIIADEHGGRKVGSRMRLEGKVLGVRLAADVRVIERAAPLGKVWQTEGEPRLLLIGRYRMGFGILPGASGSSLRIFIDYGLPPRGLPRMLGRLFGGRYARWCIDRMIGDAKLRWSPPPAEAG
jgi:hypothetical protein